MFTARINQVRHSGLEGVVRSNHINFHNRFERVDRKLLNRGEEVACRTPTAEGISTKRHDSEASRCVLEAGAYLLECISRVLNLRSVGKVNRTLGD